MGEVVEVDSKGRVVIPISIRNKLAIKPGTKLLVEIRDSEITFSNIYSRAEDENLTDSLKDFLE